MDGTTETGTLIDTVSSMSCCGAVRWRGGAGRRGAAAQVHERLYGAGKERDETANASRSVAADRMWRGKTTCAARADWPKASATDP
jgi:hypothetical protein